MNGGSWNKQPDAMIKNIPLLIIQALAFIGFQVWVLNPLNIFNISEIFLYICIVIKLPLWVSRVQLIWISFALGLIMDTFFNTPGMHAAACTLVGVTRDPVLNIFTNKELPDDTVPGFRTCGVGVFLRYATSMVVLHSVALFTIESLSIFDPGFILLKIGMNTVLTMLCISAIESFKPAEDHGKSGR